MSSGAAQMLGHPPGLNFRPDDDELVEFFLLPRVRGQPAWFPGVVIIDDDSAANTLPWKLLKRHGMANDDEAYFFVRGNNEAKKAARQDRYCDGGGTWVSQRPVSGGACIGGEMIKWRKINLNLHMGRGKSGGGSTGWVMHEYTITEPPCPSLKICRVAFSGHGKDRKRVPDDDSDCQAGSQPAPKRTRVDAAASRGSSTCAHGSTTAPAVDQAYGAEPKHAPGDEAGDQNFTDLFSATDVDSMMKWLNDVVKPQQMAQETGEPRYCNSGVISVPADGHGHCPIDEGIAATAHQQMPLPDAINDTSSATVADEPGQATDEETWGSFPFAASAGAELYQYQDQEQGMPTIEQQQQPMVQETSTMEQQYGAGDQHEQMEFWRSIGVDTDNIVFF